MASKLRSKTYKRNAKILSKSLSKKPILEMIAEIQKDVLTKNKVLKPKIKFRQTSIQARMEKNTIAVNVRRHGSIKIMSIRSSTMMQVSKNFGIEKSYELIFII
ncbi:hypothetical protein RF11_04670 [Thelohanellus kitauei]|uniref:Uncharacterized protein n=1 Tax=Thelohanellus kitauei TaxID=669202 RepID=A0A0C2ICJ9_THEKT|nr:hypothetical protein RF11_04670 [Thelohanellus kitauei]